MIKLSTMQKLFGLSLILSLFTVAVGMYSVSNLSKLSDDIDILYKNGSSGFSVGNRAQACWGWRSKPPQKK